MRTILKKISQLVLITLIILSSSISHAAVSVPEKVRIGLFYEEAAAGSFTVSSSKGLQLGFFKDNKFTLMLEEPSNQTITVRKDAFYIKNGGVFTESGASSSGGENIGPFHIQIGGDFGDYNSAFQQVQSLRQLGVPAYPAYNDRWLVWTGFYMDQNAAQSDMANIQAKAGGISCSFVQQSGKGIVCSSQNGDTILLFASDTSFFRICPRPESDPNIIKFNSRNYRGELEVRRLSGSDMTVINVVSLEQYLYGVVPAEIESNSHEEALKTQAVAARTYTLNNLGKHGKRGFDLCATTCCQVYKGFDTETQSASKAVEDTKGKVLTYNGNPAKVFYFASSGGRTEDVKNVWGSDIPYLKSVEDPYEANNREWQASFTAARIKEIMMERGYDIGDVISMSITKAAPSGRVTELVIKGTKNQRIYTLENCRYVFSLRSQWYTINTDADLFIGTRETTPVKSQLAGKKVATASGIKTIGAAGTVYVVGADGQKKNFPLMPTVYNLSGRGWGHGIGLSQEGAKGMAKAGFKYDEILTYYFQGTKVE